MCTCENELLISYSRNSYGSMQLQYSPIVASFDNVVTEPSMPHRCAASGTSCSIDSSGAADLPDDQRLSSTG